MANTEGQKQASEIRLRQKQSPTQVQKKFYYFRHEFQPTKPYWSEKYSLHYDKKYDKIYT